MCTTGFVGVGTCLASGMLSGTGESLNDFSIINQE